MLSVYSLLHAAILILTRCLPMLSVYCLLHVAILILTSCLPMLSVSLFKCNSENILFHGSVAYSVVFLVVYMVLPPLLLFVMVVE